MKKMTSGSYETLEEELAAFKSMTEKSIYEIYGVNESQALQSILNRWKSILSEEEYASALEYWNEINE